MLLAPAIPWTIHSLWHLADQSFRIFPEQSVPIGPILPIINVIILFIPALIIIIVIVVILFFTDSAHLVMMILNRRINQRLCLGYIGDTARSAVSRGSSVG